MRFTSMRRRAGTGSGSGASGWTGGWGWGWAAGLAVVMAAPAWGFQILELSGTTLTNYRAAASASQGVVPVHQQRGVNIDGSPRAGGALPWAFAGNPLNTGGGESWNRTQRLGDLRVDLGAYSPTEIDLALPATGFSWVVGRSYNGVQNNGAHVDSNGYQGRNWFQLSQPEIVLYDSATNTEDTLYIVYGADRYLEFQRTGTSSTEYKGKNGAAGVVQYASGSPDLWTYTDQHGNVTTFFGGNTSGGAADWQLWKMTDPAGNVAYVGDATTASTAVTNGYSGKRILNAYDPSDQRYTYTYSTIDSVLRLTQVKAETKASGTWASPSGVVTVGQVDYAYYQTGDNTFGANGCLKLVTVTTPLSPSSTDLVQKTYYRYWVGSHNPSTNPGNEYTIKLVVGPEGYRKFDWDQDSNLDDDAQSASTADLKAYSLAYLEYDSSYRVSTGFFNGECGCSGGNNGEYQFTYGQHASLATYVGNGSYDSGAATRTVLERPDSTYLTQYFDETGQPLQQVVTNTDPSGSPSKTWATGVDRDSTGCITSIYTPANTDSYTHDSGGSFSGAIAHESATGLIWVYTRETSGAYTGFVTETLHKNDGTGQNAMYDRVYTYVGSPPSITVGTVTVKRPVLNETKVIYQTESNALPSDPDLMISSTAVTAHSGAGAATFKQRTSTAPGVANTNNGAGTGSPTSTDVFTRADGTVAFTRSATGIYTYTQYANGRLVKRIDDCQTNHGSDFASGDDPNTNYGITETADGLRYITTYTYDAQGRLDQTTAPDGTVSKAYYTKLADGRMVSVSIPRVVAGSPTYYGPAGYTVTNLAGHAEFQGTIAITSSGITTALSSWVDKTDSDPVTALDVGTLARMTTSVLNKAGTRVEESRAYHTIPGSGAGSAGTNYDAVKFGFDDMGRKWRTKDATGTITRAVFDELGRSTESWIGTNDNSFTGGESSGPDTMVKTAATEYDGGSAGGNSYVTKRTLDPDGDWSGGNTDKRETAYTNNARGWAILVDNPQSPEIVNKYDNAGRLVAAGQYSSLSGFTITTNPTSTATARLGLSETLYDEKGQVWKTIRHKIDASDGSDDDTIVSTSWFDPDGRVVKSKGPGGLLKTLYDRMGRPTHRYALATDNDAANTYSDVWASGATTVAGDIVLEESQTTYDNADNTGLVVMQATISRFHDDLSNGTTGALDGNGDANAYKYTAANLVGRLSVIATWYDAWHRVTDTASYGTNGSGNASDFDRRPSGSWLGSPTRSDTVLVTSYSYNDDGTVKDVTDPKAKVMRTLYDSLGRKTATISNYVNGTPSGDNGDDDNYIRYVYTNGLQTKMWVDLDGDNVEDASDQVTVYTFGTTKGASAGDSTIATGHLLQKATYPDSSSGSDVVTYAYNALSQQKWIKDQAGNVVETDYDSGGRATQKRATTIISGFDDAVKRVATTYTSRGQVQLVTQYNHATVGSGSVVDEVKYTYDDWGNITSFEQDRNGTVGGGGDQYTVGYTWTKATPSGGHPALRCTAMTLPGSGDSASITYSYDSSSYALDDAASRVSAVKTGGSPTTRASYKYLGSSMLAGTDLAEPSVYSRLYSASQTYDAIDRFNRVVESRWTKDLSPARNFYEVDLAYDRNSNIVLAEDQVRPGHDVSYTMDGRNRLTRAEEGTWGGASIGSRTRDEQWTLSQPGNWSRHKLDLDGDGTYSPIPDELDDTGTFNTANEQTARDIDTSSSNDYTLTYDAVGNLTDDGVDYDYVYDWMGRLRKVKTQGGALVAEYWYNGLNHRLSWHYDNTRSGGGAPDGTTDSNDKKYHFAYDTRWRIVAVFRESDTAPKERYVWHNAGMNGTGGSSYIDAGILRDRDINSGWTASGDGTLEERVYYAQNWRADVSVVLSDTGKVKEWVKYSSYGVPFSITPADFNEDGFVNGDDQDEFDTVYNGGAGAWDARVDLDLDGTLDSDDDTLFTSEFNGGEAGGYPVLSRASIANHLGYAGYQYASELLETTWHVRYRPFNAKTGKWTMRDPADYVDGPNMYEYVVSAPVIFNDPFGLKSMPCVNAQPVTAACYCDPNACAEPPRTTTWDFRSRSNIGVGTWFVRGGHWQGHTSFFFRLQSDFISATLGIGSGLTDVSISGSLDCKGKKDGDIPNLNWSGSNPASDFDTLFYNKPPPGNVWGDLFWGWFGGTNGVWGSVSANMIGYKGFGTYPCDVNRTINTRRAWVTGSGSLTWLTTSTSWGWSVKIGERPDITISQSTTSNFTTATWSPLPFTDMHWVCKCMDDEDPSRD